MTAEEIRQVFRLIDWMMDLPRELEQEFREEIHRFEEEKQMPYVTSIERMAREEGVEQGIEKGRQEGWREGRQEGRQEGELRGLLLGIEVTLELKFGSTGLQLLPLLQAIRDVDVLRAIQRSIRTASSLDEIRGLLS